MARGTRDQGLVTRRNLVDATYLMIRDRGFENLSTREIAKSVGCAPTILYKHFESFDYLKLVASLRFLEGYMKELIPIQGSDISFIEQDHRAWHAFNRYAFANPPVFLHVFWETDSSMLEDAITEYYQLFPPQRGDKNEISFGYIYITAYSGDIEHRDYLLLHRAANEGSISMDDAAYLSKVNCFIGESMLRKHIGDYGDPGVAEAAAAECDALIDETIDLRVERFARMKTRADR